MKKAHFLFLAIVCIMSAQAAPIDQQKARQLAEHFMQGRGAQLVREPMRIPGRDNATPTQQPIYIFNATKEKGFVIVAGDDCAESILGYVEEGHYNEEQMPENFRDWLTSMAEEVEIASLAAEFENSNAKSPRHIPTHNAIPPLIKTKWNQGSPTASGYIYNTLCPLIDGKHAYTGCVATTAAQVMFYYQHPKNMTKEVPGYQNDLADTSNGLPAITFNWDKMKTIYNSSDVGTESEEAVSQLMLYCGYAGQMKYGLDGSAAGLHIMAKGMADYFDYDPNTYKSVDRSTYSVEKWDELMYNELAQKRPILYNGQRPGAHSFICDGYDGNGYYHFNWGWGGNYDGYFKLQASNPYTGDGTQRIGYCMNQFAIIGLQPNTGQNFDDFVATASLVSVKGSVVNMCIHNYNGRTCKFGFGIGELNADGSIRVIDTKYKYLINEQLEIYTYFYNRTFDFSTYDLSVGKHTLVPIYLLKGKTTWKQCEPSDLYFDVTKSSSGAVTIVAHPLNPTPTVNVTAFSIPGTKVANLAQEVVATVKSTGNEFKEPLYFFASMTTTKGSYVYANGTAIDKDGTEDVTFYFKPNKAGEWNLWVCTDSKGNNVIGSTTVTIASAPTGTVSMELERGRYAGDGKYKAKVKNTGTVDFYRYLLSNVSDITDGSKMNLQSRNTYITAETVGEVVFNGYFLQPGHTYNVELHYPTNFSANNWSGLGEFTFTVPLQLPGDANGDGEVTVSDVLMVMEYVLGINPSDIVMDNAEVTGDREISINDVMTIAEIVLNSFSGK